MLKMFRRSQIAKAISSILKPSDVTSGIITIYGAQYSGNPASYAFDGNTGTFWVNAALGSPWAGQQYPSAVTVNKATVRVGNSYFLNGYKVEYSNDGVTWTTAATVTGISVISPNTHTVNFTAVAANRWRVLLTAASHIGNIGISEITFEYQ